MVTKKITLNELRNLVKQIIKEETEKYICWDAGGGNYNIDKYNPKISWHNDADVFKGTYDECLRHKEESEEDSYRFRHNMSHKSWGDEAPDR
jgi:hypothetical protein